MFQYTKDVNEQTEQLKLMIDNPNRYVAFEIHMDLGVNRGGWVKLLTESEANYMAWEMGVDNDWSDEKIAAYCPESFMQSFTLDLKDFRCINIYDDTDDHISDILFNFAEEALHSFTVESLLKFFSESYTKLYALQDKHLESSAANTTSGVTH